MPDWVDEKAEELLNDVKNHCWYDTECPDIAAALREAWEQGAREERRKCYHLATDRGRNCHRHGANACCAGEVAKDIAARGPISEPEEEANCGE